MSTEPLASRMRPKNIDEIISQQHLVGPKGIIRRMVDTKRLSSMIFLVHLELVKQVLQKQFQEVHNLNSDN